MDKLRSKSCREGRMQKQNNKNQPTNMQDLRSFSTSYASSSFMQLHPQPSTTKDLKLKASKSKKNRGANLGNSKSLKGWNFSDPEIQRKKRVAAYNVYTIEGKMKGSFRKSFSWIKNTCSQAAHAFW